MKKKILILFILILIFGTIPSYATEEIINSQIEELNISSFIKEGESYTKDIFPDINLTEFLNSTIKGEIDNKNIFYGIFSLFGEEILDSISLLASILVIIIIHSILKNFTDNLNNKDGIGQIAYYIEYILIVTLIMANFSSIINMIKESISNLVGFINCLIPILLALMSATRQCGICFINTTINTFCNCIYRKCNNFNNFTYFFNCNSVRNYI